LTTGSQSGAAPAPDDLTGTSIGPYEVLSRLATGGMAELLLAKRTGIEGFQKVVVLKRILPHFANNPDFVDMFLHEARLAATLEHPNIVPVFDIGKAGDDYYFAMAYLHGRDVLAILRELTRRGDRMPVPIAIAIGAGVAAGLHHAHERVGYDGQPLGVVHRDVSPANAIVTFDGSVKLVDFGIAKAAAQTNVTRIGVRKGKAAYMSPEQCRGDPVDRRTDVWSLGIVLYEMLTMARVFRAESELAIMHKITSQDVVPPSRVTPDIPPALEEIVMRCLQRDPHRRWQTALELQRALEGYARTHAIGLGAEMLAEFLVGLFGGVPFPWTGPGAGASAPGLRPLTGPRSTSEPFGRSTPPTGPDAPTLPAAAPRVEQAPVVVAHRPGISSTMPDGSGAGFGGMPLPSALAPGPESSATMPDRALTYASSDSLPHEFGPPSPGSGEAALGSAIATDGTTRREPITDVTPPRRTALWIAASVIGMLGVGTLGWLAAGPRGQPTTPPSGERVAAGAPAPASTATATIAPAPMPADPGPSPADLEAWLAAVHQADPERALEYGTRHALLERLEASPLAARIDRRLQLSLDLQQATAAPRPCTVFGDALDGIAAQAELAWFATALASAQVPTPAVARNAGTPPDRPCTGLPERLADLQARSRPVATAASTKPSSTRTRRAKPSGTPRADGEPGSDAPPKQVPPRAPDPAPRDAHKLDDDELRPFRK